MPLGVHPVQASAFAVALVLAVLLLWLLVWTRRRGASPAVEVARPAPVPTALPRPAVVANPTKIVDVDGERAWLTHRCTALGWDRPLWFETRLDEPGAGAARAAVARGADTVIAYGGDGTVRAVAAGLEGTGVSLGILPMGTGNLLARNLGLPLTDHEQALEVALTGVERRIDLGLLEIDAAGDGVLPVRRVFLVMAGIGFDAEVMATVEPALKQKVGWLAYVVAGLGRLRGRAVGVTLTLDDGEPIRRRVRSVVIGNCGELTGGVQLLPDAKLDDGWLDLVVVAPRYLVAWSAVLVSVLTKARRSSRAATVQHLRCRSVEIRADRPLAVQIDGDPAGEVRVLRARLDPLGLVVRTPGPGR